MLKQFFNVSGYRVQGALSVMILLGCFAGFAPAVNNPLTALPVFLILSLIAALLFQWLKRRFPAWEIDKCDLEHEVDIAGIVLLVQVFLTMLGGAVPMIWAPVLGGWYLARQLRVLELENSLKAVSRWRIGAIEVVLLLLFCSWFRPEWLELRLYIWWIFAIVMLCFGVSAAFKRGVGRGLLRTLLLVLAGYSISYLRMTIEQVGVDFTLKNAAVEKGVVVSDQLFYRLLIPEDKSGDLKVLYPDGRVALNLNNPTELPLAPWAGVLINKDLTSALLVAPLASGWNEVLTWRLVDGRFDWYGSPLSRGGAWLRPWTYIPGNMVSKWELQKQYQLIVIDGETPGIDSQIWSHLTPDGVLIIVTAPELEKEARERFKYAKALPGGGGAMVFSNHDWNLDTAKLQSNYDELVGDDFAVGIPQGAFEVLWEVPVPNQEARKFYLGAEMAMFKGLFKWQWPPSWFMIMVLAVGGVYLFGRFEGMRRSSYTEKFKAWESGLWLSAAILLLPTGLFAGHWLGGSGYWLLPILLAFWGFKYIFNSRHRLIMIVAMIGAAGVWVIFLKLDYNGSGWWMLGALLVLTGGVLSMKKLLFVLIVGLMLSWPVITQSSELDTLSDDLTPAVEKTVKTVYETSDFALLKSDGDMDSVLATVNGKAILLSDIIGETGRLEMQSYAVFAPEELPDRIRTLRLEAVDEQINRELVITDFKSVPERRVEEKYIEMLLSNLAVSQGCRDRLELAAWARRQNTTLEALREEAVQQLMCQMMYNTTLYQKVNVTPQEVYNYLQEHRDEFVEREQVRLRVLRLDLNNVQDKQRRITEVLVKDGGAERFGELVQLYSSGPNAHNGGDLGWIDRDKLRLEFAKMAEGLAVGEVSEASEIPGEGIYYLQLLEIQEPSEPDWKVLSKKVQERLHAQAEQKAIDEYHQSLREKAIVRYFF